MSNTVQRRRTGQSAEFVDVAADVYFDNDEKAIYGKGFSETNQDYFQVYSDKVNHLQVIDSNKDGAGTIRPMSFQMGGSEVMRLAASGLLSVPNGVTISGGGSLTVSAGGQVNTNTLSVLVATNTMSFVSSGGAFTFDSSISLTTATALFIDATDGTAAAVAPANHGRIIYNNATHTWQVSTNTGAYASIATGSTGGTLTSAYNFGGAGAGRVITVDAGPVSFTGSGTPGTPGHLLVDGAQTIASAAGATWDAVSMIPTVTLSGSTHITTATGFNMVSFAAPTISAASALTVDTAATVTIMGAPTGGGAGPATVTTKLSFWVQAGQTMLPAATAPLPALCFGGDKTTGFYRIGADSIGIACAGNVTYQFATNAFQINSSATGTLNMTYFTNNVGRLIRAEPASNSNDGILTLGVANTQISLCTNTNSYGTGKGVILIGNAGTNPSTNPVGGGLMYSNAGAGTWRGSGGTVTAFGPAGPHCETCGYDAWTVSTMNTHWKSWHFVCGHCGADYRGGPQHVHDRLNDVQKSEYIRKGMTYDDVARIMRING